MIKRFYFILFLFLTIFYKVKSENYIGIYIDINYLNSSAIKMMADESISLDIATEIIKDIYIGNELSYQYYLNNSIITLYPYFNIKLYNNKNIFFYIKNGIFYTSGISSNSYIEILGYNSSLGLTYKLNNKIRINSNIISYRYSEDTQTNKINNKIYSIFTLFNIGIYYVF